MKHPIYGLIFLLLLGSHAIPSVAHPPGSYWNWGLSGLYMAQPYVGLGVRFVPIPLVAYEGRRIFVRGPQIGINGPTFKMVKTAFLTRWRFAGYDPDDSGFLNGMEKRRDTLDSGFQFKWDLPHDFSMGGEMTLDTLGRHNGREVVLYLEKSFRAGPWSVSPSLGLKNQDGHLADYYFGVRPEEGLASRHSYSAGSVFNWTPGLNGRYAWGENKMIMVRANIEYLDNEIRSSPIVEKNSLYRIFAGFMYKI